MIRLKTRKICERTSFDFSSLSQHQVLSYLFKKVSIEFSYKQFPVAFQREALETLLEQYTFAKMFVS